MKVRNLIPRENKIMKPEEAAMLVELVEEPIAIPFEVKQTTNPNFSTGSRESYLQTLNHTLKTVVFSMEPVLIEKLIPRISPLYLHSQKYIDEGVEVITLGQVLNMYDYSKEPGVNKDAKVDWQLWFLSPESEFEARTKELCSNGNLAIYQNFNDDTRKRGEDYRKILREHRANGKKPPEYSIELIGVDELGNLMSNIYKEDKIVSYCDFQSKSKSFLNLFTYYYVNFFLNELKLNEKSKIVYNIKESFNVTRNWDRR